MMRQGPQKKPAIVVTPMPTKYPAITIIIARGSSMISPIPKSSCFHLGHSSTHRLNSRIFTEQRGRDVFSTSSVNLTNWIDRCSRINDYIYKPYDCILKFFR